MEPDDPNGPKPFPREPIPPDLLEWARQTLDEEEILEAIREIEETGGLRFEDFIGELEAIARGELPPMGDAQPDPDVPYLR